jgi:hypothetical protein
LLEPLYGTGNNGGGVATIKREWPLEAEETLNMPLDPWGPVLGVLFEDGSSDYVLGLLRTAGIPTDFKLTPEETYSHKTRKRAYEQRLGPIYVGLDETSKRRVVQNLARQLAKSNVDTAKRLNEVLESVGWTFRDNTLMPLSDAEQEAFFAKGSDHDAYIHIRAILQTAKRNLFIIDPYLDGTIYQVLGTLVSAKMTVKILTSKVPSDFVLEARKFVKQHSQFTLELRKTKDFHDRFIILDEAKCYLMGASIKDAGSKGFAIVAIEDPGVVSFILNYAKEVWTSATLF